METKLIDAYDDLCKKERAIAHMRVCEEIAPGTLYTPTVGKDDDGLYRACETLVQEGVAIRVDADIAAYRLVEGM